MKPWQLKITRTCKLAEKGLTRWSIALYSVQQTYTITSVGQYILACPQLKMGGMVQARVYNQIKIMVRRVESGVDRGNCRS